MAGDSGERRKRACEELARRLATEEGLRTARLLQRAGVAGPGHPSQQGPGEGSGDGSEPGGGEAADREAGAEGPRPISIWQPREVDGEVAWVRPEPSPLGDHYAARRLLGRRHGPLPRRIAFFGESAAAGYLYAPHVTPARLLEAQLTAAAGPGQYEVVDLARTNETLGPLAATVEASLQLQPDLLVLFTGNNFNLLETPHLSPYAPSVAARQEVGEALAEGGLAGVVEAARRELGRRAGRAFTAVARAAGTAGVPVVLVLPEVNLADWESRQPVAWLPGDGTRRWWRAYGRARRHLAARRWRQAAAAAWEMVDLDGETCPTSCRLLARAYLGSGDEGRARLAAVAEVDADAYPTLCFLGAPRATTTARELLQRAVGTFGWTAVDLRPLFVGHTGSALPGRRLFLDYCHLTREGMEVAMTAVAAEVLGALGEGGGRGSRASLLEGPPSLPLAPEAEATALLGAAVHTAHRLLAVGDKAEILEHWCRRALAASPGVAAAMVDLVAVRTAPCPAVLTGAQQRNLASPYRLGLQHGWQWDGLDADLLAALAAVLEEAGEAGPGETLAPAVARLGVGRAPRELVHPPFFLAEPLGRCFPEVMRFADRTGRAILRCHWPETGFNLLSDGGGPLRLEVTLRLPAIPGVGDERRGKVAVLVNGSRVGAVAAGQGWRRAALTVGGEALHRGLNRVTLCWPELPPVGDAALAAVVRRLELGREADLHPVFGEVFSLTARVP